MRLGIVAYELLGGKPGGFAPLANVSEKGNEVLRKCLTPDRSFSTAAEFYELAAWGRKREVGARGKCYQACQNRSD